MHHLRRSHGEADVNKTETSVVQQLCSEEKQKQKFKQVWMIGERQSTQAVPLESSVHKSMVAIVSLKG